MNTPRKSCFGHRNCQLNTEHLMFIADNTVSDWRRILKFLGIEENEIRTVEEDSSLRSNINDSREVAYQGYLKWKNRDPENATFCIIQQALSKSLRNDVTKALKEKFNFQARINSQRHKSFSSPVKDFIGRDKEVEDVLKFCGDGDSKLLHLYGMPGVGKSELLKHAISSISQKKPNLDVVRPIFTARKGETSWGLEDIAVNILEEIHPGQVYINFRVAALHHVLVSLQRPMLLVLEMCGLELKQNSDTVLSAFLNDILRTGGNHLKIIFTSYKAPEIISSLQSLPIKEIQLKGLSQTEAFKVLRIMNPRMTTMNCKRIYERCGSHPYILRKIGAHIKNFHSNEKELESFIEMLGSKSQQDVLHPMLASPFMKHHMKLVFNELEEEERKCLVKLCGFSEIIPIDALNHIFGPTLYHTSNHLCINHCIIEKSNSGRYFKMNLLTKTYIKEFAGSDPKLKSVLIEAREKVLRYYLQLMKSLDEVFHFPSILERKSDIYELVSSYREECVFCPDECSCPIIKIVKCLFRLRQSLIMRAIQQGLHLKNLFYETVEISLKVVHFLRFVVSHKDLLDLYDEIFTVLKKKEEKVLMAMVLANLVFVKIYNHVTEEREENIQHLSKVICFLRSNQLFTGVTETLVHCYMKRGHLSSFLPSKCDKGLSDFKEARLTINSLGNEKQIQLLTLVLNGYESALYYNTNQFQKSVEKRKIQVNGYRDHFGIHTYVAKALHYQSQAYNKVGNYTAAIKCALISYGMFRKIYGDSVETMRILSTIGKLYINADKIKLGFKKLDDAKDVAEKALGNHERVAQCYEQIAHLKQVYGSEEESKEVQLRAKAIRKNFEMKSIAINMKKYSLQLSRDHLASNIFSLKSEDKEEILENSKYVQIVFFIMLVAIIWRMFEICYTCNCDRLL